MMRDLAALRVIPPMAPADILRVRNLEEMQLALNPKGDLPIQHDLHAGMYARTVMVPAGIQITGALIKIPTILIVSGDCFVTLGAEVRRIKGYAVFQASAGRKQAFRAVCDTWLTMIFPTMAQTVEAAERAFTDESHLLANRRNA
jgi:hypothetical protein